MFSLEERGLRMMSLICANIWDASVKKLELGCFQWHPVTQEETMGTN